jgi:hypothetical protein
MPQDSLVADHYSVRQEQKDHEYQEAWKKAPQSFLKKVAALKIKAKIEKANIEVIAYEENYLTASHTPNVADHLDTKADELIEKFGGEYEEVIRHVVEELRKPMEEEVNRRRSMMIGRVAGYLVKTQASSVQVRVHQLLHAIPGLAIINGLSSMRDSARVCRCSPQAMKKGRDEWCKKLEIPVPKENSKSDEAKGKYKDVANGVTGTHWRKQIFGQKKTDQTLCKPNRQKPNSNPQNHHSFLTKALPLPSQPLRLKSNSTSAT